MNKRLTILVLSLITLLIFSKTDTKGVRASAPLTVPNTQPEQVFSRKLDKEAEILSAYLSKFDSPMQYNAQDFIDAAREYNLDWKLLPAIAGVESTFGKQTPGGYNAYGWGVYGTQAMYFGSWREGMFAVAKGLRENYFNKGLTDPFSINRIYAASPFWGSKVSYFMQDLEKFANNYQQENVAQIGTSPNIAAVSGQIASN